MSFLWGAIVGTASPIPYWYSIFFITVLIHRCGRDFERYIFFIVEIYEVTNNRLGVRASMARTGNATAKS
jgi:hypothetical protein